MDENYICVFFIFSDTCFEEAMPSSCIYLFAASPLSSISLLFPSSQCIEDAPCDEAGSSSSDDCKKDRLWGWQEKECSRKSSESSCENCCEDFCDQYHSKSNCYYYYKDCVDDVSDFYE